MGFQRTVNLQQALAVAGDFASSNPRVAVLAPEGAFVAGPGGVTVGKFAWIADDGRTVLSHGTAPRAPDGFVHREMNALITEYLGEASMIIPEGFPVTLMAKGDFFAKVAGDTAATRLAAVYATYSNGDVTIGSAVAGGSATGSIGSTNTGYIGATFTATGVGTTLTVTSVTGFISVGDEIDGDGVEAGTTIVSQISGTPGGAGDYETSEETTSDADTVTAFGVVLTTSSTTGLISVGDNVTGGAGFPASATVVSQISGTPGGAGKYELSDPATAYVASATGVKTFGTVLHITAVSSGSVKVGDPVSGTGVPAGAVISEQIDGADEGIGNYRIDVEASDYAASTTITVVGGVLTSWKASLAAAVGELTKITTWE